MNPYIIGFVIGAIVTSAGWILGLIIVNTVQDDVNQQDQPQ